MGKIYITRHGETILNTRDAFQGASDAEETWLTDRGFRQAEALYERLKDVSFDVIYSSPLKRARDTAEVIRHGRDIPLLIEEGVNERFLGEWEGRTHGSVREEYGISMEEWKKGIDFYPEKAESPEALKERAEEAIRRLSQENIDKDILIVTHCIVLQPIFAYIKKKPVDNTYFAPQASLTVCEYDGEKYTLLLEADTSHLKGI